MELLCPRDLARRLGAIVPESLEHFRQLRAAGHILVRDPVSGQPLFWPQLVTLTTSSS